MIKKRTPKLTLQFADGFSINSAFAIPESCRAAFDIRLTAQVKTDKATRQKSTTWHWTEGDSYDFHRGDIFYDAKQAYVSDWKEALLHIKEAVQVIRLFNEQGEEILEQSDSETGNDFLEVAILIPNNERTTLVRLDTKTCRPKELVHYLKRKQW